MFIVNNELDSLLKGSLLNSKAFSAEARTKGQEYPLRFGIDKDNGAAKGMILVPGFSKDDISASYDYEDKCLVISGYAEGQETIWKNSFKRRIGIDDVAFDLSTASFDVKDGILNFSIERSNKASRIVSFEVK